MLESKDNQGRWLCSSIFLNHDFYMLVCYSSDEYSKVVGGTL